MNWFYVQAGNSVGPIIQSDFDNLVRSGVIGPETLVWQEGMPDWLPYGAMIAATPAVAATAPTTAALITTGSEVACAECNRIFPRSATIQYGSMWVCPACQPAFVQRLRGEGLPAGLGLSYAGFWMRFLAYAIDIVLLSVTNIGIAKLVAVLMNAPASANPFVLHSLKVWIVTWCIQALIGLCYETFFLGGLGATPGKLALRLRVVRADGSPISYLRALGRYFARILSGALCLIGYIMVAFDSEKRALHDYICGTRVAANS